MRKLIGLCGHAGAGKDFVFGLLRDEYDFVKPVSRVAFADGLKLDIEEVLMGGYRIPAIWNKPYKPEVRAMLQWWGTELRRSQNENYWVDKGMERVRQHDGLVVVTDVRFANEAEAIRAEDGIIVEVRASDETRARRLGGQLPPAHASEVIDFEADFVIDNDRDNVPPYMPKGIIAYLLGGPVEPSDEFTFVSD